MSNIKTVGVRELKNKLSAYLRDVRAGTRVLVSDRNRVIAELHEPRAAYGVGSSFDPQMEEWIETGVVTPPSVEKTPLPKSPISSPGLDIQSMIDADREDKA
jgi:antitoxin (DNA-binding transcriptional repressor) of toxin-antitoxin stability system